LASVDEDWPHGEVHPPPALESVVLTVTGVVVAGVTVSTSDPQVLVEAALVESPE
jgi:hypothetical protein